MLLILLSLAMSFAASLAIIRSSGVHGRFSADDASGPQKIHSRPVPRIGGVAIALGVVGGTVLATWDDPPALHLAGVLLLCALPTFVAGLTEDFTKNVSPLRRMIFAAVSAALAALLLGALIHRTGWGPFDAMLALPAFALVATMFAMVGVTNSVNIIDGFNGLASMCVLIMTIAVAAVAHFVGDHVIFDLCLVLVGAVLGFFAWNYPGGLIFLGDGGAYFLGFLVAELALLLLVRNDRVAPMFPLLVCIYPVFETVFSIYRRRFIRRSSPGVPDGVHLHHLIFKRLLRWTVSRKDARALTRRNSMTSPYLWALCLTSVAPAVMFWDRNGVLFVCIVLFAIVYSILYWRIVRFRTPRWLGARRWRALVASRLTRRRRTGDNTGS